LLITTSVLLAGCSLNAVNGQGATEQAVEEALVREIIDGDTVRLEDGTRVRYLGIDTPEMGEYYYDEATQRNRELVEGKVVELQPGSRDVDDYGRLLRYVYVDGLFVNAELVAQGYATAYRKGPEEEYSCYLFQLEEEAKTGEKGLWAEP
jgi:micrococcal nuclease